MVERCVRDAEVASSNLVASMKLDKACWSSGQDDALSRRKPGFDSRIGHRLLQCAAALFLPKLNTSFFYAIVAQPVEHFTRNEGVACSNHVDGF